MSGKGRVRSVQPFTHFPRCWVRVGEHLTLLLGLKGDKGPGLVFAGGNLCAAAHIFDYTRRRNKLVCRSAPHSPPIPSIILEGFELIPVELPLLDREQGVADSHE